MLENNGHEELADRQLRGKVRTAFWYEQQLYGLYAEERRQRQRLQSQSPLGYQKPIPVWLQRKFDELFDKIGGNDAAKKRIYKKVGEDINDGSDVSRKEEIRREVYRVSGTIIKRK